MEIPFLDLKRQINEIKDEIEVAVNRVLDGGNYVLGNEVQAFESEWASYCGMKASAGVDSGTDAISLALVASGAVRRDKNDEVITTPLSAGYTALAIRQAGAIPVFADIKCGDYTIDPDAIKKVITKNTRAIVPVHLYGQLADMKAVGEIARRHNLAVVEDAAQAHGFQFDDLKIQKHAVAFSFYPTKNLGANGDGGAVVSNDTEFIERVKLLRQGGHLAALKTDIIGHNSRLDEMQAAILRVKLKYLDGWNEKRKQLAQFYQKALAATQLKLPAANESHVFHLYVVGHGERELLRNYLAERGIETLVHYPFLLHRQPLFRFAGQPSLPVAERLVERIFSLPLYPQLLPQEAENIVSAILDFET